MTDRLVVHPAYGQAWFYSACMTDALMQAAAKWDCEFADLLDGYWRGEVRVLVRKGKAAADIYTESNWFPK